eukprot:364241_1
MFRKLLKISGAAAMIGIPGTIWYVYTYDPVRNYPSQERKLVKFTNGRILSFIQRGDPNGKHTIFCFHGAGGSRFEGDSFGIFNNNEYFLDKSIRIISLDRPGYGESTFYKNCNYKTFCNDLNAFCQILNINKFGVFGVSSGACYALNCAKYFNNNKLKAVAMVSSDGPNYLSDFVDGNVKNNINSSFKFILKYFPFITKFGLQLLRIAVYKNSDSYLEQLSNGFKGCVKDYDIICDDSKVNKQMMLKNGKEGFRQGVDGLFNDLKLQCIMNWDFDVNDLDVSNTGIDISIWHGTNDILVSVAWAEYYMKQLPNAKGYILEDEGHVSVAYNYYKDIFDELIQSMDGS